MFGLSMAETAVIAVVALIFLGPDKLPGMMRGLAKLYRQLGRLKADFSKAVNDGLGPELSKLKPEMSSLNDLRVDFKKPVAELLAEKAKKAVLGSEPFLGKESVLEKGALLAKEPGQGKDSPLESAAASEQALEPGSKKAPPSPAALSQDGPLAPAGSRGPSSED
jgi:sec-independent protein translocase protein TatB